MLPTTSSSAATKRSNARQRSSLLWLYFRRLLKPTQMDFQYAFWTMIQLAKSPKTAYKHTSYHKQTKNQWARDDPAFVVIQSALLAVVAFIYAAFFSPAWSRTLSAALSAVIFDYLTVGSIIATAGWILANNYLKRRHSHNSHAVDQSVEWMYAFDIHCNAYFPMFLILHVLQLFLIPILTRQSIVASLVSCFIYFLGMSYYLYVSFLGYSTLPFLEQTEVFLYPIGLLGVLLPFAVLLGVNPTRIMMRFYFGKHV